MGIIVEGRVTLSPASEEDFQRFVQDFETIEKPWLDRQGTVTCGGWRRRGGARRQLLNLYRFGSFAEMQAAAVAGREDAAAITDLYGWLDPRAFHYRRHFHIEVSLKDDGLAEVHPGAGERPRQYVEIRRRVLFRQQAKAMDLFREQIAAQEAAGVFELAIAYDAMFGDFGDLTIIGVLPDGAAGLAALDRHGAPGLAGRIAEVIGDEQVYLLDPLSYSPLR